MKILCCGDRNWANSQRIKSVLQSLPKDTIIIEGEAKGADTISRQVAESLGMIVLKFPADWTKYGHHKGSPAGPIRNRQMLDQKPDKVYAFHNDIKNSKGTKDCVTEAILRNIPVKIITEQEIDVEHDIYVKMKPIKEQRIKIRIIGDYI